MPVLIEACCGSVEEAIAAEQAGADRIELCAAFPTGGVTPSLGMFELARESVSIPIVVMVRPREGRADPDESDFKASLRDVRRFVELGADEVICGVLSRGGTIDVDRNRALVAAADGRPVAFHRVFDQSPDLCSALEEIIGLGFCRVLTSGGALNVDLGFEQVKLLVTWAGDHCTILPGGGVRPHNARRLVAEAGCRSLHFSFRKPSGYAGYATVLDTIPDPDVIHAVRAAVSDL